MLSVIFICLIVLFIGYLVNKEITTFEFITMCIISVVVSLLVFLLTCIPAPNDVYYLSGRIQSVQYEPYFKERYEQVHYETYACGTDREGNTKYCTRTYYTTEYARHPEKWVAIDTLQQRFEITQNEFYNIKNTFGDKLVHYTDRRRFSHGGTRVAGDSSLYFYANHTNSYFPTTRMASWFNPIKRTNNLFNNKNKTIKYPQQTIRYNQRLMANTDFNCNHWDVLNTKIYEQVGANVILLNYNDLEEVKDGWLSGKKNDIIIGFIGDYKNPTKVKVFGWYEDEILSAVLEEYLLDGITKDKLNGIESIIVKYYKPFDFTQFKYLKTPAIWQLVVSGIITLIAMFFAYCECSSNYDRRC